jgi:hypothetical protein
MGSVTNSATLESLANMANTDSGVDYRLEPHASATQNELQGDPTPAASQSEKANIHSTHDSDTKSPSSLSKMSLVADSTSPASDVNMANIDSAYESNVEQRSPAAQTELVADSSSGPLLDMDKDDSTRGVEPPLQSFIPQMSLGADPILSGPLPNLINYDSTRGSDSELPSFDTQTGPVVHLLNTQTGPVAGTAPDPVPLEVDWNV